MTQNEAIDHILLQLNDKIPMSVDALIANNPTLTQGQIVGCLVLAEMKNKAHRLPNNMFLKGVYCRDN